MSTSEAENEAEVVAGVTEEPVLPEDATEQEKAVAEELADAELPVAEALAEIVDGEFGIEMVSPWGDRWIWVAIDAERAQEIYKVLGQPVTFQRVGTGPDGGAADVGDGVGPQQAGPAGGETSAE